MKIMNEEIQGGLKKILESAERCKKVVENLLTFSRQKMPSKSLESINDLIDRTIDLRIYWLRKNNIEIVKEYGELPTLLVDSQQLQLAILNVLLNAEQALGSNIDNGMIRFSTRHDKENHKVIIKISDNGPGIPQDIISKIFDPFFTTKPVGTGTGLGLSISHGIIAEHEGNIRVESSEGRGATFFIELPQEPGMK
jgi:signal transduction histidine kinase